jgi:hypothetical protein
MTMRAWIAGVALVAGLSGFAPLGGSAAQEPVPGQVPAPAAQEPTTVQKKLQLTFDGQGNVTLIAQGVTLQEILAEWTRIGGCYFPNAEKLSRAMLVPLHYEKMPELTVLDSLLRSAAGMVVAPRTTRTVGASAFELVQILPTSTATQTGSYSPISTLPPMPTAGNPDDEIPPITPVNQPQRGADPSANRPPPTAGVPGSGVFVPIQPVPSGSPAPGQPPPARPGMPTPIPSPPPAGSAGS